MSDIESMTTDHKVIERIVIPSMQISHSLGDSISVDGDHIYCDGIFAYNENGQGAKVPWIAVLFDDRIVYRYPAHMCAIEYQIKSEEE